MGSNTPPAENMMAAIIRSKRSSLPVQHVERDSDTSTQVTTNNQANHKSNGTNGVNRSSSNGSKPNVVPVPGSPRDIICGRGLHIMNHHGNHNLHLIVDKHRHVYLTATRKEKAVITQHIVEELKSTGVRFLRRFSADKWVEVDEKTAYKKVGHALRLKKSDHGQHFLQSLPVHQMDSELSSTALHSTSRRVETRTSQDVAAMPSIPNNPMIHPSRFPAPASLAMQLPLSSVANQLQVSAIQPALRPYGGTQPQPIVPLPAINGYGRVTMIDPQNTMIHPSGLSSASASLALQLAPFSSVANQLQVAPATQGAIPPPYTAARRHRPTVPSLPAAVNGFGNVVIDPLLLSQFFSSTLALMTQIQNQQPSSFHTGSAADSRGPRRSSDEE